MSSSGAGPLEARLELVETPVQGGARHPEVARDMGRGFAGVDELARLLELAAGEFSRRPRRSRPAARPLLTESVIRSRLMSSSI